MIQVFP